MKRIIAPVDFSATAENAAIFAGSLAAFYGADLWLYHAYEKMTAIPGYAYPIVSDGEMQAAAENELNEIKQRVQSALRCSININIKADDSGLAEGLTALCGTLKADLVVMGLTGKNALARLVAGSNTLKIIKELTYPVLVVPAKAVFEPVRKIGFASDYQQVLETTPVQSLKKLVADFNADLYVLNIVFNNSGLSVDKWNESEQINELLKELKPTYQTVMSNDVTNGINWYAQKEKLDWMVLVPRKHKLLEKLFLKSQTEDLLYHTRMPILCMHE
ncbi:MAG: universal stress protein [Ferruginibacter sp.]